MRGAASGKFRPGDRVRVKTGSPPGHIRTPAYVRGKIGRVQALHGTFRNPESLAFGGEGLPKQTLYQVGFPQGEIWERYDGPARDTLYVDIYEHWLEPL